MSAPAAFFPIEGDTQDHVPESDNTWPASKRACCFCKRNKVRCEGGRPCTACKRKGLSAENCIDGCIRCRHDRLLCNGGTPCTNCQSSAHECVYYKDGTAISSEASLPLQTASGDAPPIQQQYQVGRTRIACLACRRLDNKKCGEIRPCSRCLSRREECISLERTQMIVKKRCLPCRIHNRKCEDQRPCARCIEEGEACVDVERKGTGPGSRVKKACTNCKRLKVQCDDNWPCRSCSRRKLECDAQDTWDQVDQALGDDGMYQSDAHTGSTQVGFHGHSPVAGPSSQNLNMDLGKAQFGQQNFDYDIDPSLCMQYPGTPIAPFPSVPVHLGYAGLAGPSLHVVPSSGGTQPDYATTATQRFERSGNTEIPQNLPTIVVPAAGTYTQSPSADIDNTQESGSSMYPTFTRNASQS